jgi:hypothetical protein
VSKDIWAGDYNRPLTLNGFSYVENNAINMIDPSGLKGYWLWDVYQSMLSSQQIDLTREPIRKREIYAIMRNLEGNPSYDAEGRTISIAPLHPTDVHLFDTCNEIVKKFLHDRTPLDQLQGFPSYDLNRADWLFSGWTDYWVWRAGKAGREPVLNDPNILKAIALAESSIGDILTVPGRSFMNLTGPSGFYEMLSQPTKDDKNRKGYDMNWGTMDVTRADRFNRIIEVGAVARVLYAKYNATSFLPRNISASSTEIWQQTLQTYGPGPSDAGYSACYGDQLLTLATKGVWYRNCDGSHVYIPVKEPDQPYEFKDAIDFNKNQ